MRRTNLESLEAVHTHTHTHTHTEELKNKKGITLVALIVTIIILLILAGITISQLTGSGLFEKAQLAEEKSKEAQEKEDGILGDYENKINQYLVSDRETTPANSRNTMSATEHFIGEYYFNGKPIYAKTIYVESLPNSTKETYNHNVENVDQIWYDISKCFAIWPSENNIVTPLSFVSQAGVAFTISLTDIDGTTFAIGTGKNRTSVQAYVTLNYTKTTDTGNGTTIPATPAN